MSPTKLQESFYHDTDRIAESLIDSWKLNYSRSQPNLSDPLLRWMDFTRRYIPPEPRHIETTHLLPKDLPPPTQDAYLSLLAKIRRGDNLNPHQGRGLIEFHDTSSTKRQGRTDLLFADWGIHHLHLSTGAAEPDKFFAPRSGWVLFGIFQRGFAGLIDVRLHGKDGEKHVFAQEELIRAAAARWPRFMNQYQFNDGGMADPLAQRYTAAEREQLRQAGITPYTVINGRMYMPPGMGVTTASTAGKTSMDMMAVRRNVKSLASMVAQGEGQYMRNERVQKIEAPDFKLALTPKGLAVYETKTRTAFPLPRENEVPQPNFLTQLHEVLLPRWVVDGWPAWN